MPVDWIVIKGRRQTGKTEKIVWMTVGEILAGGNPAVIVRDRVAADLFTGRLCAALAEIRQDSMANIRQAARVALEPGVSPRGLHHVYEEVDLP